MANEIKRVYHPLVLFFFYSGMLSDEQLAQIPKTTVDYWRRNIPAEMFGYLWVSSFAASYKDFQAIQKYKIIFKAARLSCKLVKSLSVVMDSIKGYKKALKNNMALVVNTIDRLSEELPFDKICKVYNISTQQYYRWKNKVYCTASIFNLCYKTHPQQLSHVETIAIKEALCLPANVHKKMATIWYSLMREGKLFCSRSVFYKYTSKLDERKLINRLSTPGKIIKATRVFEYIHIDTTFVPTLKDGLVRVVAIKDNFSKNMLHCGVVRNGSSQWVALLLRELFVMYDLINYKDVITLVSDGGSENKGEVDVWINKQKQEVVIHKIARTIGFGYTNNDIESVFNVFKNEFLIGKEILDSATVCKLLTEFQRYYNNERYPLALYGLTPQEVFEGMIIDRYRFTHAVKQARKERIRVNKIQNFCKSCF